MGVAGGVASCAGQRLLVPVGDVLACFGVLVPLGQTEINQVNHARLALTHKEVIRFHIAMDEVLLVHEFEATNHLICQHQRGLHGKLATTVLEQVFQRLAEQLHDEGLVVSFDAVPIDFGDASYKQRFEVRSMSQSYPNIENSLCINLLPPWRTL